MTGFSLRKGAVGAYFNDGDFIASCQIRKEREGNPDPKIVDAVKGARDVFFALYGRGHDKDDVVIARLRNAIAELTEESLVQGVGPDAAAGKT